VDLIHDYCRREEKVKKKPDRNIVRKGGNGKEDGDNGIWILTRDDCPDFGQIDVIRANEVRVRGKES